MPSPRRTCPRCGGLMSANSTTCRQCQRPYERTASHRERMSAAVKEHWHEHHKAPTWTASTRPDVHQKIREIWTPERREQKRQEMYRRYPDAPYAKWPIEQRRALIQQIGHCKHCGATSGLITHHIDRDTRNQDSSNLMVLCRRCHGREHTADREIWLTPYREKCRAKRSEKAS